MMRYIIVLLSCIICGGTYAFTPASAKLQTTQNKKQSSTAIGYLDTEDFGYHRSLHQLDDFGVDLLDDITTTKTSTASGIVGWGDITVDPHTSAMDVVHQQQPNNNDGGGGGGVAEVAYSFLPVAILIVLESVVYHAHASGVAVFPQSMFH